MNEEIKTEQNLNPAAPVAPAPAVTSVAPKKPLMQKLREEGRVIFSKFYSNKKLFWPTIIVLSLLLLVIILGLLFGTKKIGSIIKPVATQTPQAQATPVPATGPLAEIENLLVKFKSDILKLDMQQKRLQPPTLDFKIRF